MKEIDSFEAELNRTKELGHGVVAIDSKLAGLIESELNVLNDSYQSLQNGAHATHVCAISLWILF